MAASLGSLVVSLGLDAAKFTDGLTKSEYKSKQFLAGLEKSAKVAATAVTAAGAAAAGVALQITRSAVEQGRAFDRLSQVAGTSARDFQYLAVGARTAGVEQDKLADILKDVNDKVGDFLQTGAGPMADFFEQIAPKVGVTAAQFRELSGPQALGLYVSSLEKAGLSQAEMTFYMEAIASDATLLLPLLRDNAAGFKEWGDAAADAGAIMSGQTIQAAKDLDAEVRKVQIQMEGWRNFLAADLLPDLVDLARSTESVTSSIAELASEVGRLIGYSSAGDFFDDVSLTAARAADFVASVAREMSGLAKIARGIKELDWSLVKEGASQALSPLQTTAQDEFRARQAARIGPQPPGLAPSRPSARRSSPAAGGASALKSAADEAAKQAERIAEFIAGIQTEVSTFGMDAGARKLFDLEAMGAGPADIERAKSLLGILDQLNAAKEQADRMAEAMERGRALTLEMRTPVETLRDRYAELEGMVRQGAISWETYGRAVEDAQAKFDQAVQQSSTAGDAARELGLTFSSAFEDAVTSGAKLSDVLRGLEQDILRIITRKAVTEPLADWFSGAMKGGGGGAGGGIGGWIANAVGSLFGGGRASGGPVQSGRFYEVNERGTEMLTMGGRDYLMAGAAGRVKPALGAGSGAAPTINMTVVTQDAQSFRRSEAQVATRLGMAMSRANRFS